MDKGCQQWHSHQNLSKYTFQENVSQEAAYKASHLRFWFPNDYGPHSMGSLCEKAEKIARKILWPYWDLSLEFDLPISA